MVKRVKWIGTVVCLLMVAFLGFAQEGTVGLDDVEGGWLLFSSGTHGRYIQAPTLDMDVSIEINGPLARTRVVQTFRNTGQEWLEGLYVFPLPEKAAVDTMRMVIGNRIIEGQIKEKQEAREIYEQAKEEGRQASLMEQSRPNLFTMAVANIPPGEKVRIEMEYQQMVKVDGSQLSLRFPLTITRRYQPPQRDSGAEETAGAAITRPVAQPLMGENAPQVNLTVKLDPGLPIDWVRTPNHDTKQEQRGRRYHLKLKDKQVPANRDFLLVWSFAATRAPLTSVFRETTPDGTYLMMVVVPPSEVGQTATLPREVIFVIDTSGSMQGESMIQARQALIDGLGRVKAWDRFNVIEFNHEFTTLFPESVPANPDNLRQARDWVGRLEADGGTEMMGALQEALIDRGGEELRQVIFLTDGAVGNESQLFAVIRQKLGRSRLFTVGIGSAPNDHFMSGAARFGRGTFTFISDTGEVAQQMDQLFAKLENPVMGNLKANWFGAKVDVVPEKIPDLYLGEPVILAAKIDNQASSVEIFGSRAADPWSTQIDLSKVPEGKGVAKLWAREKIQALGDTLLTGADQEQVKKSVVELALKHHLVSRYTSLVAVDVTPVRPEDAELHRTQVPNAPPGGLPQGGTRSTLSLLLGLLLALGSLALWQMGRVGRAS